MAKMLVKFEVQTQAARCFLPVRPNEIMWGSSAHVVHSRKLLQTQPLGHRQEVFVLPGSQEGKLAKLCGVRDAGQWWGHQEGVM